MRFGLFFGLVLLTVTASARADNITVFNLSMSLYYGSASGTVTIDTTAGVATGADVFITDRGITHEDIGILATVVEPPVTTLFVGKEIALTLPGTLVGYRGGSICTGEESFIGCDASPTDVYESSVALIGAAGPDGPYAGELVPSAVATTPEPISVALLGTGLFGVAGVLRRRTA